MKKILRMIAAFVTVAALVIGMLPVLPSKSVHAASNEVKLYFKYPSGITKTSWGLHVWGGANVINNQTSVYTPWNYPISVPALNQEDTEWGSITIRGMIDGCVFISAEGGEKGRWNSSIAALGLAEAYYDTANETWYKEKACINKIDYPVVNDSFALIGEGKYLNDWNLSKAMPMTKSGDDYSVSVILPAGSHTFLILQDSAHYAYDYKWGMETDPDRFVKGGDYNISFETYQMRKVTFIFTVTERDDSGNAELVNVATAATIVIYLDALTAPDIMNAINAIGTVTLASKEAIEYAQTLYAELDIEARKAVNNYNVLVAASTKYNELKKASEAKDIKTCTISGVQAGYTYSGKVIKPAFTIKDGSKTLKSGTDFTISYKTTKDYYVNSGTKTFTIIGKNGYKGTKEITFKINPKNGNSLTFSKVSDQIYTGKNIKPAISIKDGKKVLKKGTDYSITYKNFKKVGFATITIQFKGNYIKSKSISYKIAPAKVQNVKVNSKKSKTLVVTFNKASGATNYEVSYTTDKKFKNINIINTKNKKLTISKLKPNKKYYVKVRSYKLVNGKKIYSKSYSKTITKITKK